MTEGWVECPALGPGWKRRETARKSGATCGRTDTYYQSPTGEKFRSKVELSRFLGASRDLSNFDFKQGLELEWPRKPRRGSKWPPSTPPPLREGGVKMEEAPPLLAVTPPTPAEAPPIKAEPTPAIPIQATPLPVEAPPLPAEAPPPRRTRKRLPQAPPHGGVVACCASCQSLFPGVTLGTSRRCRWLCPDCRARRREFNRQQRFYKRIGCGSCQACRLPTDCGLCSACLRRTANQAPAPPPEGANQGAGSDHALTNKCLLRRCLRIVKKTLGCGSCSGCRATEDCGCCYICLRRLQPGLRRQWRCLLRRCLRPRRSKTTKKLPTPSGEGSPLGPPPLPSAAPHKWKPPQEPEPSANPSSGHRLLQPKEQKRDPKGPNRVKPQVKLEPDLGGPQQGPAPPPPTPSGAPIRLPPLYAQLGPGPHLEDPRLKLLVASTPRLSLTPPGPPAGTQLRERLSVGGT